MRTVAIVQARMGSIRLPGKVLKDVCGETVLARVINRLKRCQALDEICVATSVRPQEFPIVRACKGLGVKAFRGDESDVLDRFYNAALALQADVVIRITADCPLIDPVLVDDVIRVFNEQQPDYVSNALVRRYPRGLDSEAIAFLALERAWREAREPHQRAHVTPYLYEHREAFNVVPVVGAEDHGSLRWTLDREEDLAFIRAVYGHLKNEAFGWQDVVNLCKQFPELQQLNAGVLQKDLCEC